MPAWGTVTMSPACRGMLLAVSPVSTKSLRFTVMMLLVAGGLATGVTPFAEDPVDCAGFGASNLGGSTETVAPPLGMALSGPIAGGSVTSTYCAGTGLLIITLS